jgi:hypothetical protein
MAMLAGPSLTGLLLTVLVHRGTGLREFAARLLTWRVGAKWYGAALLTARVLVIATLLALSSMSPAFLPGIFISDDKASLLLVSVGVSAGIFEEGERAFSVVSLRPALESSRHPALRSPTVRTGDHGTDITIRERASAPH